MSKGLEELKDLKNAFIGYCRELKCETNYIKVCENKFSKIEKELKAFEIIKDLHCFSFYEIDNQYYISGLGVSKEKYNLLKEVLL